MMKESYQTVLQRYEADLNNNSIQPDDCQADAVAHLQRLQDQLVEQAGKSHSLIDKVKGVFQKKQAIEPEIMGLYFWGGVGRGKTYLMDIFFDSLPIEKKMRLHFHRFMQKIHAELTRLQGESDPLVLIADELTREYSVICLDEFFVKDITDAMILAGLLDALFNNGVVLVTTSNIEPKNLYLDGLQRARFLPAIGLLERFTRVINVDGGIDYRLRALEKAELFHWPLDKAANESLMQSFKSLAPESGQAGEEIEVLGRSLKTVICADDVVWFEFDVLCAGPRSQNDYIELARVYHAVLISNVPVMSEKTDDLARRFINLIDEFYDRNVKVIISAEQAIESLYSGGRLEFEFERTRSRLLEMQSREYLAREHRP